MKAAPVVLFAYNRCLHLMRTIESLKANSLADLTDLVIFSDGPKRESDQHNIIQIRQYLRELKGFKKIHLVERTQNFGLSESIIQGVTEVVASYEKVIVLEDDMITSPYFLHFMNKGLQRYDTEDKVISVHGYVYPAKEHLPETFFLRGADCWGWATWKRGWDLFDQDGAKLLSRLAAQKLFKRFDMDGAYPYAQMLRNQVAGKNDSWAIRWHASAFLANKLTLYPGKSLVRNIGIDSSGTHCPTSDCYDSPLSNQPITVKDIEIVESELALQAFMHFLHVASKKNFRSKVGSILKSIVRGGHIEKH